MLGLRLNHVSKGGPGRVNPVMASRRHILLSSIYTHILGQNGGNIFAEFPEDIDLLFLNPVTI